MGSQGNGGGWPPDGGVPDLPPEWGDIVIPDDPSALAEESAAVRAELRRDLRRGPWQRLLGRLAAGRVHRVLSAGLRLPVLVITLAVLVTVASLFASTWPGTSRPPAGQRTSGTSGGNPGTLPALELIGDRGQAVPLLERLPAVILLVDRCACAALVEATAAAAPAPITVVTVTTGLPAPASAGARSTRTGPPAVPAPAVPPAGSVRHLWDPTGELRAAFHLGEPEEADVTADALLVDHTGRVVRTVQRTASVEDLRPDLARLT